MYQLSRGNRVTWCHDFLEVKAQITRIYKDKAEILTDSFEKIKVPLSELELVPVVLKKVVREQENTIPSGTAKQHAHCTLTDDEILPNGKSVREQEESASEPLCTLTDENQIRDRALHPNSSDLQKSHWIEEKMIKRAGKLHGPYRYERWRDETGKMKSKYLGKKPLF